MLIEERVKEIIDKPLKDLGFSLVELTYHLESKNNILRIIVDRPSPIGLEDIVRISDRLSPLLDEADVIDVPYTLDVTTLGVEKPLEVKSLEHYVGQYVNLHLSHPYRGANALEGEIKEVQGGILTLLYKDKTRSIQAKIDVKDIDKARIAIKF